MNILFDGCHAICCCLQTFNLKFLADVMFSFRLQSHSMTTFLFIQHICPFMMYCLRHLMLFACNQGYLQTCKYDQSLPITETNIPTKCHGSLFELWEFNLKKKKKKNEKKTKNSAHIYGPWPFLRIYKALLCFVITVAVLQVTYVQVALSIQRFVHCCSYMYVSYRYVVELFAMHLPCCSSMILAKCDAPIIHFREAKQQQKRIWKGYRPPTTTTLPQGSRKFCGKVVEVVNGDALVIKRGDQQHQKIWLSSIRPPR